MLTKSKSSSKSITFSQLKAIRKQYLSLINHDITLIELSKVAGVTRVLDHLEKRYKRHTVSNEDIVALHYIINNFDYLNYNITWY